MCWPTGGLKKASGKMIHDSALPTMPQAGQCCARFHLQQNKHETISSQIKLRPETSLHKYASTQTDILNKYYSGLTKGGDRVTVIIT